MRRRIVWVVIGLPLALIVLGARTALAWPTTRHMISGLWNLPDRLPALPANSRVHYQPGAEDFARDVAALLPDAIRRPAEAPSAAWRTDRRAMPCAGAALRLCQHACLAANNNSRHQK
jgi:hypothetical protein